MKREHIPVKTSLKIGIYYGLFLALIMTVFDYFSHQPFSTTQFIFYFLFFGLSMAFAFRYKYTKV